MERTKVFTVLTKLKYTGTWKFTEHKNENDYGNGIYIDVETPSGDHLSLDCRYTPNYTFHKACVRFLTKWYGENIEELSEDVTNDN